MSVNKLFLHTTTGTQPYPHNPKKPRNASSQTVPPEPLKPQQSSPAFNTLEDLANALKAFEHPLKKPFLSFVFSDGSPGPLMLIGEAPGEQEDKEGKPFVGKSGQLLTRIFKHIGFARENLYITNIVPWRPPQNRTPSPEEIKAFTPFIREHIRLARPKVVIVVGNTPLHALFGTKHGGITRVHGQWLSLQLGDIAVSCMPIFHPAYLLRNPSKKKNVWFDLLSVKEKLLALNP